jgi:ribosomal protein S18 acetylase RimI-like enzyme
MAENHNYDMRFATNEDESFLFEMLYQSLYIEKGQPPFLREVLNEPKIARYVKNWGRESDLGFIAESFESKEPVGAIWCRLADGDDRGFGYLDDETPELAMAVLPEYRGKGIGTILLERFLATAAKAYPAICLSVSPNNPAIRLYERFGFETVEFRNKHPVMRLMLN